MTCDCLSPFGCHAISWSYADILFNGPFEQTLWTYMVWAIYCLCVTLPGLHWGLLLFKMSPDQWRAITWTTADLLFIETFWTNSGFTFLKPSLLWFATFKKTSLSRNHTAGPLCRDPTGLVGSLHRDQQCVFLGVSLNKLYDVMEVISVLLAPCAGNPQTPVDSPHKWSAVGIFFWCTSC